MKLTIFGATGGTGRCLVEQALAAGHEVTAVVRDPARLGVPAHQLLHVETSDVLDPDSLTAAVAGADAVLSAIGPRGTGPTTITRDSAASIVTAMHKAGARRLVMVSGSIVADAGESLYLRYLIKPVVRRTFLRHVCADMRMAEETVRGSGLDWTVMRPPSLTSKPGTGRYRTAIDSSLPHAFTASRADLAASMLAVIGDQRTVRRYVCVAS